MRVFNELWHEIRQEVTTNSMLNKISLKSATHTVSYEQETTIMEVCLSNIVEKVSKICN